jgi:hypothetical protein
VVLDLQRMSRELLLPDEKTLEKRLADTRLIFQEGSTRLYTSWRRCN